MTPTPWCGVLGTGQYQAGDDQSKDWRVATARFACMMAAENFQQLYAPDDLFEWSGNINGWFNWRTNDWESSGDEFAYRMRQLPEWMRRVIAHSYGAGPVLRAALKVKMAAVVTIGTPAHSTLRKWGAEAIKRGNLPNWHHFRDSRWDTMGTLGGLIDLRFALRLKPPFIDRSFGVGEKDHSLRGIGHSGILWTPDPALLRPNGFFDALRAGEMPAAA